MLAVSNILAYAQLSVWIVAALSLINMSKRDDERSFVQFVAFLWAIANVIAASNWLNETHMSGVQINWIVMRSLAVFTGVLTMLWALRYGRNRT